MHVAQVNQNRAADNWIACLPVLECYIAQIEAASSTLVHSCRDFLFQKAIGKMKERGVIDCSPIIAVKI